MESEEIDEDEMTLEEAIAAADALLPGIPAPDGELDARWAAIMRIDEYDELHPQSGREAVWEFILRWGAHPHDDVRMAIACCLLEHVLDRHWGDCFPRAKEQAKSSPLFAGTLSHCWLSLEYPGRRAELAAFNAETRKR